MNLPDHKTKIVCTIGPASRSEAVLEELVKKGMNVARLNFAHGTLKTHKEDIRRIRAVAVKLQRYCLIMVDLPGPKIRIGKLRDDSLLLEKGDKVILTIRDILGTPDRIPVEYKRLPESVSPGSLIFLNDGFIQLQVEKILADEVFCRTIIGGPLLSHKGLNLPGVKIFTDVVSESDLMFVDFALAEGIDTFGISFVESADDIMKLREFTGKKGKSVHVVAKIERAEAINNIDEILDAADAIMIARGDMGVQIPLEDVPAVQKKLIHQANLLGRPVITATQMLVTMTENIRPTRAEVSDVANAVLDGTDAVMLSEETAIGRYPVESVEMMAKIVSSAERERVAINDLSDLHAYFRKGASRGESRHGDVLSLNAVEAAQALKIHYIIVPVQNGTAPCLISRFKPDCWILLFGGNEALNNFLNLSYGVSPIYLEHETGTRLYAIMEFMEKSGFAKEDDRLIFVEGTLSGEMAGVDSLRIITTRSM